MRRCVGLAQHTCGTTQRAHTADGHSAQCGYSVTPPQQVCQLVSGRRWKVGASLQPDLDQHDQVAGKQLCWSCSAAGNFHPRKPQSNIYFQKKCSTCLEIASLMKRGTVWYISFKGPTCDIHHSKLGDHSWLQRDVTSRWTLKKYQFSH